MGRGVCEEVGSVSNLTHTIGLFNSRCVCVCVCAGRGGEGVWGCKATVAVQMLCFEASVSE